MIVLIEPGVDQRLLFTRNSLEFGISVGYLLLLSGWSRLLRVAVLSVLTGLNLLHQVVLSSAFNLLPLVSLDSVFLKDMSDYRHCMADRKCVIPDKTSHSFSHIVYL